MYALYTLLLLLGGVGLLPHILWRCLRGATYHRDLAERFGYGIVSTTVRGCQWLLMVSRRLGGRGTRGTSDYCQAPYLRA